jgi:ribonuclease R
MRLEGRVVEVLQRGQSRFVGALRHQGGRWYVLPEGNAFHAPIAIGDPGAKSALDGDHVVVEILQFPTDRAEARGVIIKTLGRSGEPGVDAVGIIEQYQLPTSFDDEVLKEAQAAVRAFDPSSPDPHRRDLTGEAVITIDPTDARDFDDAISLTSTARGMELGVHIADVAYFVRPGGAIDGAAHQRATSVYLPGMVLPMLPEVLSNGVCSLQEREPRFTKSVFITFDEAGHVVGTSLANSVIRSTKRLTYEEATAILEGKKGKTSAKVVALLKAMERLALAIRQRRTGEGMLELDLPEAELVLDAQGQVTDVQTADTSFSHKIIEMFMVEANEAVARFLHRQKVRFLRRIHEEPDELKETGLLTFLKALGHRLPRQLDRFALQSLLNEVRGHDDAFPVHLAILRSMKQAEYSPRPVGHYALASEQYCHFTSPIRRYPDLTVHRLVDQFLSSRRAIANGTIIGHADLDQLGAHCSRLERMAEAAERELKLVLTLRLLEGHVGEDFTGIVTVVAQMGLFVQVQRFLIDGLVRFDAIPDDWWEIDSTKGVAVGQRSGRSFRVGDRLDVRVIKVNCATRQLDLGLAKWPGARRSRPISKRAEGKERKRRNVGVRGRAPRKGRATRNHRGRKR